jgi:hypothetical protein
MTTRKERSSWGLNLTTANVATMLVLAYALLGAVLVILSAVDVVGDPSLRLSFDEYLQHMAIAAAGLAVGRGLTSGTKT